MFFLLIAILIFLYIDRKIKPKIIEVCNFKISQFASNQIGKAMSEAIDEMGNDYSDYVTFKLGKDDQILAVQTNAKKVTTVNNIILDKVSEALEKFEIQTINIHIGSISGINFFSGRGWQIPIKIVSKGISNSEIVSTLEEAGINQTMHKIRLIIEVEIAGFFAGVSTKVKSKSECVLSESIIVGSIPSHYTNIKFKNPQIEFPVSSNEKKS